MTINIAQRDFFCEWLEMFLEKEKILVTSIAFFSHNVFLILYHTILTFNNLKEDGFGKQCEKRQKCW